MTSTIEWTMDEHSAGLSPSEFGAAFQAFMEVMAAAAGGGRLLDRLRKHLGADPTRLPVVTEEFPLFDYANVQVAVDELFAWPGYDVELVGVAAPNKRMTAIELSDLLSGHMSLSEGPVDYVNVHLAGERVLRCVRFGLYLVTSAEGRLAVFIAGTAEHTPMPMVRVEVMSTPDELGPLFLRELGQAMLRHDVYRGQIFSLEPHAVFQSFENVAREDVVLPPGVLERVERQTIGFARHAAQLAAARRSLKRGLLLYGPPGTGKTHTVRYLSSQMPGRTVILLTGKGMHLIDTVARMARRLAPAMVVIEDVDLIAEERTMPGARGAGPLLFQLLNEMDGLREDSDLIFVLTTNRPDLLEPALAARPGRIDLAIEFPLPDETGRRQLFALYTRGLELEEVDPEEVVRQTEGASPAYIKELVRRAALLAAEAGSQSVRGADMHGALEELQSSGELGRRLLGFQSAGPRSERVPSSRGGRRSGRPGSG
jgi:hypothetical protein